MLEVANAAHCTSRTRCRAARSFHGRERSRMTLDLTVFDPRNRPVWQQSVKLNDFGSFHSHYLLPAESAIGDYRISITDNDRLARQQTFPCARQAPDKPASPMTNGTTKRIAGDGPWGSTGGMGGRYVCLR